VLAGKVLASDQQLQVMLGDGLARSLKASPGSNLTLLASTTDGALNALDVTVAGIVSTGVPDLDRRLVYTDIATAQKLLVTQRVSSLGVFLDRMAATAGTQQRLQAALPDLKVQTWLDQAFFYRSVKELYNRIFGALGLIIGVIVVFVVTNAMAMAVIERTREIGTLRALGTLPAQLVRSFALEGLLLGGLGAAMGAALAPSACRCWSFRCRRPPGARGLSAAGGHRRQPVRYDPAGDAVLPVPRRPWWRGAPWPKPVVDALAHV
jgi:putative ABC transport system permease protein